jgi:predicted DCC family thiol-disulfide oxidoreductase YuxK
MNDNPLAIVFYDGVCGLCNRSVRWLIRHDHKRVLRYASLQSELAKGLPAKYLQDSVPGTIVFRDGETYYEKSDAVIRILLKLKGIYRLAGLLAVIPRPLRNAVYDWIARNRYKWFGKYDACPIPGPEEKSLFKN